MGVDRGYDVAIGVLTERYTDWQAANMKWCDWSWCYDSNGTVHPSRHDSNGIRRLAYLERGSIMRVTLNARRVTFNVDGRDQHTVILPQHCGNISLGVSLGTGDKVTLLP